MGGIELPLTLAARDGTVFAVRRLTRADAAALHAFNAGLSEQTRYLFMPHGYDDARLQKVLVRSETGADLTLGVFDGDRLIGYFFLWHARQPVPILGIGITDGYQGRGLGRPMMRVLIDAAKQSGRDGLILTTRLENDRAFALYQSVGFQYYGDVDNVDGEGRHVPERGMFLPLRPGAERPHVVHAPPV